jgi:hypothetical protein
MTAARETGQVTFGRPARSCFRRFACCAPGVTQFTLLNAIETRRPDSISRLGEILDIDRTTLSLLEKAGLVHLGKAGARRKRELLLTSRGLDQLRAAYPRWQVVQDRLEALFGEGELDDLKAALGKIQP